MATIDKRVYEDCGECGRTKLVSGEYPTYVCDCCDKHLNPNEPHNKMAITASVHSQRGEGSDDLHYCSWRCLAKHLPTVECDYFISLPFLKYDGKKPDGLDAAAFLELLTAGLKATEEK